MPIIWYSAYAYYMVEEWCQINNGSISSSLNHLYDNTWGSSSFARLHLADCFRHHLWFNLNCRSFYWGFFTHIHRIPWILDIQKLLIMRLPDLQLIIDIQSWLSIIISSTFLNNNVNIVSFQSLSHFKNAIFITVIVNAGKLLCLCISFRKI